MKKFLVLALTSILWGCAAEKTMDSLTPEELYLEGYKNFQETNYEKAAEYFDEVDKQYPYSKWAERSQIMAAYAYYRKNMYEDAIGTLDRFIQLHPGNRNTPYAYYLKGLSCFEQISDPAREQSMTEKARNTFNELIARYPDTPYAVDAQSKIGEMTNHLASQEMVIGRYYLKQGDIIPAINRFNTVIGQYVYTNQAPEAYYRLIIAYKMLGMKKKNLEKMADIMIQKHPNNPWTLKAMKAIEGK